MAKEENKEKKKSVFESTKEDYTKVRTQKGRADGLAYRGDIDQLAGSVLGEFKSDYFGNNIKKGDLEDYISGVGEHKRTGNIDGLLGAGSLAFRANSQYEIEKFKSNFDEKNLESLLDSSPDDVLLAVSSQSYKKDYSGKNQETYSLHQAVRDIEILSNEKSSEGDKKGAIERITQRAIKSYEENRTSYDDKRVDELVKQLDIVFGIPQRKYQEKPDVIVKKFVEGLKKNKGYLLEIADTEKLAGIYASYFESIEQQKSRNKKEE